jgi:DNA-binding SARP family transcriptional activator
VEYRILGPLEVRGDDGPLALGGAKQRALLALLLLNANRVVARERLIDELWGESPPLTAVTTVQVYVSRLRKLIGADALVTRAPGYVLQVEPEHLDLLCFERLLAEAREADGDRASELLSEAIGLWRGPALAEFEESFARVESGRLEELRLGAVEERVDADLALGRHAELIGELETLVIEHPHRERLRRQLMLALYRSERQAEALAAYRDGRAALDALGIEPSERLRALERQILMHDLALDLAPQRLLIHERVPLPGPLVPESPFPFVGREAELGALRALLARAEEGEGGVVLVTGEPGAGKTRLVCELARAAADRGVLVLYGVSDAVVSTPYQPLREWLEFLLRVCEPEAFVAGLGGEGWQLARLVPDLERLGISGADARDVETDRYLFQGAATKVLTRLSGSQPLLVLVDDLHWADTETLNLLRRLARAAPEARLLVVAAYRDPGEEISPQLRDALADLSRLDAVRRVSLGGLSDAELAAFVHASTDADASGELTSAISELTDGTPLLVCELWRDLRDSGGVEISNGGAQLTRPVGEVRGPDRINEVVQQRLSRLALETGRMIELAAVVGPRFELRLLAAAAGLDQAALTTIVVEAGNSGILEELPAPVPTCRFVHELVRRAVYDRLPRVRLPVLHLSVGEALERLYASDAAQVLPELAHHFTLAAPVAGTERGVEYNVRAADAALASAAHAEAAARFSSALVLGVDDPRERVRLQVELGKALFETGRSGESEALLATARDAAGELAERGLAERALVQQAKVRLSADPGVGSADVVPVAVRAIETFEALGDMRGLAEAEDLFGEALVREGRRAESLAVRERALAHARAAGAAGVLRDIVLRFGNGLCDGPTPVPEAIGRLEELMSANRDDRVLEAALVQCRSFALAMAGHFDESRAQLRVSIAVLDESGETNFSLAPTRWTVADADVLMGDGAGAERELLAVYLQFRDARGDATDSRALQAAARLALLYCDQGRWREAADYLAYGKAVDGSPPVYGKHYTYFRLAARARVAAHRGESSEALALGEAAVEAVERTDRPNHKARIWLALAEVERAAGNNADADAAVQEALALFEQKGNVAAAARLRNEHRIAAAT